MHMKKRILWASALALAVTLTPQLETMAQDGIILITARRQGDTGISTTDLDDIRGPGQISPGDTGMHSFLGDNGYSSRLVVVNAINSGAFYAGGTIAGSPTTFLTPGGASNVKLIILTAGASAADNPDVSSFNIPTMTGEFGILGTVAIPGSLFMYAGTSARNPDAAAMLVDIDPVVSANAQYMTLTAAGKLHPIMQGIPFDASDRVKMVRDKYPGEDNTALFGGKPNYEFWWVTAGSSTPAGGTEVLATSSSFPTEPCFSVMEVGGALAAGAPTATTGRRLVHLPFGEQSTSKSRRTFNALSDIGKVIFLRAAKWAMGETLTPYVPLGVIKTTLVSPNKIELKWTGSTAKNYKVLGTANLNAPSSTWETVAQDIPGVAGVDATSVKLDISNGPQYAFFRVTPVP